MAGTSLNDLLYDFLKKITSATSGSTEDMAMVALLNAIDPTLVINASDIVFDDTGNIAADTVQLAIQELDTEKLAKTGDTLARVYETAVALHDISTNETLNLASANVHYFVISQNAQLTMPAVPTTYSQSGIMFIKNATGKAHTWNTTPAIRFVGETDADTVPTPAADGKYTRYTYQSVSDGVVNYWAITLAGKDTA